MPENTDTPRYEIRTRVISEALAEQFPDLPQVSYLVWDNKIGHRVPFGSYRDLAQAQARVDRELRKS